jgi:FkbM family methyltransferase
LYILKNPEVNFDLSLFTDEDKYEIIKFVRNKLYVTLGSKIPKEKLFDENDLKIQKEYEKFIKTNVKSLKNKVIIKNNHNEFILPLEHIEMPVFFHKLGVNYIPREVKNKIKNTDFIDAGAFIGDSALILNELKPNRIFAFEPEEKNFELLNSTINMNKINNIFPVKKGLGETSCKLKLFSKGSASFIPSNNKDFNDYERRPIEIVSIDNFVKENSLNIGLIKMDIEGFELEAIKGAKETIKTFKPVLIISLYHRGKDFFEIPYLLKKLVPSYNFRFLNLNRKHPCFERILLAYNQI